jgi:hypothetical protein
MKKLTDCEINANDLKLHVVSHFDLRIERDVYGWGAISGPIWRCTRCWLKVYFLFGLLYTKSPANPNTKFTCHPVKVGLFNEVVINKT